MIILFDGGVSHPRADILETEFDGLKLFIKPSPADSKFADAVSAFVQTDADREDAVLRINRFLSALAWKERRGYATLGHTYGSGPAAGRLHPPFNYDVPRERSIQMISEFDFEHLQNPTREDQKLALALYRDGLACNNDFYRFLGFFKIINILHRSGPNQTAWINRNLGQVGQRVWGSHKRLEELRRTGIDIGSYLYEQGRCAIAHASYGSGEPIRDPDKPTDQAEIARDMNLMQELAEIFIEQELSVPSLSTIWKQHLYELAGFKEILGSLLARRLSAAETVPLGDFPEIPRLTISLKEKAGYEALRELDFRVAACETGRVLLLADPQPASLALVLDFPAETLDLPLAEFRIDPSHPRYSAQLEITGWRFLIDYFRNGYLEVREASTGTRLSHKTAFLPENIDGRETRRGFEEKIRRLEDSLSSPRNPASGG